MRKIWISSILSIFFCSVTANAANLLANPHFDFRTTNWAAAATPYLEIDWSDSDAMYSPTSGSLQITSTSGVATSFMYVKQCVEVTGGTTYDLGAKMRVPPFQLTTGRGFIRVFFMSGPGCSGSALVMEAQYPVDGTPSQRFVNFARPVTAPPNALSAEVQLVAQKFEAGGRLRVLFDDAFFAPAGSCVPDHSQGSLCLGERFRITAKYAAGTTTGDAKVEQLTSDSGSLWFFSPSNAEVFVKVLDGCGLNQRYWFFAAGLTDLNVELTVTDKKTGLQKAYRNDAGHPFAPIQDTDAFATCQ